LWLLERLFSFPSIPLQVTTTIFHRCFVTLFARVSTTICIAQMLVQQKKSKTDRLSPFDRTQIVGFIALLY